MKLNVLVFPVLLVSAAVVHAEVVTVDFEGLQDQEGIGNYYNGGNGSLGSGPGPSDGITFSSNSLAIIQDNAGGIGNFGGEPSPNTAMFFVNGSANTMDVAAGFDTGFSFYYSSVNVSGSVNVYSGLDGAGTLLATLTLPVTPNDGGGCPTNPGANFCPFEPVGVTFTGTAESVNFGGTADQIAFDNITLGSETPTSGTPEPSTMVMMLGSGLALAGFRRFRKA